MASALERYFSEDISGATTRDDSDATQLPTRKPQEPETDEHRVAQRQKQVDFGKNTLGYQRYLELIPKDKRRRNGSTCTDPVTPDVQQKISKRAFDGQIKVWRRALHQYDPNRRKEGESVTQSTSTLDDCIKEAFTAQDLTNAPVAFPVSSPTKANAPGNSPARGGGHKRGFVQAFDTDPSNPKPTKLGSSQQQPQLTSAAHAARQQAQWSHPQQQQQQQQQQLHQKHQHAGSHGSNTYGIAPCKEEEEEELDYIAL